MAMTYYPSTTITLEDKTLSRPAEYNITLSVTDNTPLVVTTHFPFEVVFNTTFYLVRSTSSGISTTSSASTTTSVPIETYTSLITSYALLNQTRTISSGLAVNEWTTTATLTTSLNSLITCGAEVLIRDMRDNQAYYSSFISANTGLPAVQNFTDTISEYSNSTYEVIKSDNLAQLMANYYNFLFIQSPEIKSSMIDEMGYCFLQMMTQSSTSYDHQSYSLGDGWMFSEVFKMGSGLDYLTFTTDENSHIQEMTITANITEGPSLFPVFPTSVTGTGTTKFGITLTENAKVSHY
ncbi:unnamed protein product [Ambrosiozyma monospora]|uniref:Unnamed protein product n=1 Tax=Ambrosiozyma monospora TaxID=43982 RepID=A0ACB5TSQ1_AMBMO|nr:unnamed protein product [Ambrosiozyma monospora]